MEVDTVVAGGTVVLPDEGPQLMDLAIVNGKIAALLQPGLDMAARQVIQAAGLHIFPGAIDPHVHFGIAMPKASDYYTESCAAASGGVTTVINYDRAKAPYSEIFPQWMQMAVDNFVIDFGFHLGILTEDHLAELEQYVQEFGITSFKFYMNYRGAEKSKFDSDTALDDSFFYRILSKIVSLDQNLRLCVHCENMEITRGLERQDTAAEGLALWDALRPGYAEAEAVNRSLFFAETTGASVYVVHLSAGESVDQLDRWDLDSLNCHIETCPHYLCATIDTAPDLAKVNPPVRHAQDTDALWGAIERGIITAIGSDHVPRTLDMKRKGGDFASMNSGFPGVNLTLPLLLTEGYRGRNIALHQIARLTSTNVARIFGIYPRKGTIAPGSDADLVFVDLKTERTVVADELMGASGWSIYEGRRLIGWPVRTMVRGETVYADGRILKERGFGQYLARHSTAA
jgi:dihydropyrimidinase